MANARIWVRGLVLVALGSVAWRPAHAAEEPWQVQLRLGSQAEEKGRYAEAEKHFKAAVDATRPFGEDDIRLAECHRCLACNLDLQGRYSEAEGLATKSLAIMEKARGADSPDLAPFLATVAATRHFQGKPAEAEPLYRRVLAIREKEPHFGDPFGGGHSEAAAAALVDLASCCASLEKLEIANSLLERARAIYEAKGRETLELSGVLFQLGQLRLQQDRNGEAETILRRCLEIQERELGKDHPDISSTLYLVAYLLEVQEKFAEAEPLSRRSVAIAEKALGPNHPELARALYGLGCLCENLERDEEAESVYKRALAIWKDDPNPLFADERIDCLINCADVLRRLGKDDEANAMDEKAEKLRAKKKSPVETT